jgi:hypothetical protein
MMELYKPTWWGFALAVILIVAVAGVRTIDHDVPTYLSELVRTGSAVVLPDGAFVLEGLLPDLIGILLTSAPAHGFPPSYGSWAIGLCCVSAATGFSIWNGSIGVWAAFLGIAFTRVVDTVFLWVGKTDPLLVAFLVLAVNRNLWIANLAGGLAAFCHPLATVASIVGVNAVTFWLERRVNFVQVGVPVVCAAIDLVVAKVWISHGWSRVDYPGRMLPLLIQNGVRLGIWRDYRTGYPVGHGRAHRSKCFWQYSLENITDIDLVSRCVCRKLDVDIRSYAGWGPYLSLRRSWFG